MTLANRKSATRSRRRCTSRPWKARSRCVRRLLHPGVSCASLLNSALYSTRLSTRLYCSAHPTSPHAPRTQLWFYRELSLTGSRSTLLDTLQTLSESAASAVLLAVLLFAALGWSLTRERLSRRELQVAAVVFGVFSAIALVQALCSARDGGRDDDVCKVYLLTEYVIRSALMLGVVVALNYTIAQLRLALTEARWDHRVTPITYMKLRQFQYVYVLLRVVVSV